MVAATKVLQSLGPHRVARAAGGLPLGRLARRGACLQAERPIQGVGLCVALFFQLLLRKLRFVRRQGLEALEGIGERGQGLFYKPLAVLYNSLGKEGAGGQRLLRSRRGVWQYDNAPT